MMTVAVALFALQGCRDKRPPPAEFRDPAPSAPAAKPQAPVAKKSATPPPPRVPEAGAAETEPRFDPHTTYRMPRAAHRAFTGQATAQGSGLLSAFYALGWSWEGRFAYAVEHKANDMALEYGVVWTVADVATGKVLGRVDYGVSDWEDEKQATLWYAWSARKRQIVAMLRSYRIRPTWGVEARHFPLETRAGKITARWSFRAVDPEHKRAVLRVGGAGVGSKVVFSAKMAADASGPASPLCFLPPHGDVAAILVALSALPPFEGLIRYEYTVRPLEIANAAPLAVAPFASRSLGEEASQALRPHEHAQLV